MPDSSGTVKDAYSQLGFENRWDSVSSSIDYRHALPMVVVLPPFGAERVTRGVPHNGLRRFEVGKGVLLRA